MIQEGDGSFYLCSKNIGADQLYGYRAVDLCVFLFSHMQKTGFLMTRLIFSSNIHDEFTIAAPGSAIVQDKTV